MSLQNVSCDSLGDLDYGAGRAIIDSAIRNALNDLEDVGPQDGKPRKVSITLTFKLMDNGQVGVKVDAVAKVPPRGSASTFTELRRDNKGIVASFRKYSPEDPNQATIDEVTDEPRDGPTLD